MPYRIKNWGIHYETSETKKLKHLRWVPVPNKMDDEGYAELVEHQEGAAHLGAWLAILEIASRQDKRGNLPSGFDGKISQTLSRISRIPSRIFDDVLPRLEKMRWIEEVPQNQQPPATPGDFPGVLAESPGRIEGNGIEETLVTHTQSSGTALEKPVACVAPSAPEQKTPPLRFLGRELTKRKPPEPVSQRFLEWLSVWPAVADRDGACRAWVSRVTPGDEEAAFACRDRYLASEQVSRGIIQEPKKFIMVQADSHWTGTWINESTQLDPNIAVLREIDRKLKEEDDANRRNGSKGTNIQTSRLTRVSETAGRLGINPSRNGNCH